MYKYFLRPIFFLLAPESAHHIVTGAFKFLMKIPGVKWITESIYVVKDKRLEREFFGIKFPNPVGLAAGFDKQASFYKEFKSLGFGFVEVGTITPKGQLGNPQPRMFRLPQDQGLINRMGFNNHGLEVARQQLEGRDRNQIIGGNIGKNKVTPNENAIDDYIECFHGLHDLVDYFVVNVSSPNTPGLRELQDKEPLLRILNALKIENTKIPTPRPILLKIAPDLTDSQLDDIVDIVAESKIDGIIATNTTISRNPMQPSFEVRKTAKFKPSNQMTASRDFAGEGALTAFIASQSPTISTTPRTRLKSDQKLLNEAGGLSGSPVRERSTEVIRYLHEKSNGSFPIIGVGGIHSAEDALEKLNAGASLVQIYTGLIYEGPDLIKQINKAVLSQAVT